ncbi:uncharacterized protein LOC126266466 isoform X2 [Aethina tumida]|uniref:uncharacterized protein LOC126266466 isoform X2 n=1 Tax=Aethina tumida TaxID=116153 RepID=UPI002148A6E4|nr:uncharacterized protein LOC126266466 isoform X2 [Aethina tumida]
MVGPFFELEKGERKTKKNMNKYLFDKMVDSWYQSIPLVYGHTRSSLPKFENIRGQLTSLVEPLDETEVTHQDSTKVRQNAKKPKKPLQESNKDFYDNSKKYRHRYSKN